MGLAAMAIVGYSVSALPGADWTRRKPPNPRPVSETSPVTGSVGDIATGFQPFGQTAPRSHPGTAQAKGHVGSISFVKQPLPRRRPRERQRGCAGDSVFRVKVGKGTLNDRLCGPDVSSIAAIIRTVPPQAVQFSIGPRSDRCEKPVSGTVPTSWRPGVRPVSATPDLARLSADCSFPARPASPAPGRRCSAVGPGGAPCPTRRGRGWCRPGRGSLIDSGRCH